MDALKSQLTERFTAANKMKGKKKNDSESDDSDISSDSEDI